MEIRRVWELCEPRHFSRYCDKLRAGRFGVRISLEARYSAFDPTGPGAHLASRTMRSWSLLEVQRPGRDVDHPDHLEPKVKERVEQ